MNEFQDLSRRTISDKPKRELLANFALGLCGEAGEVSEPIKKHLFHGKDLDESQVEEELGDALFYLAGLCSVLGFKLEDVARQNVEKLRKRHPHGFQVTEEKRIPTGRECGNKALTMQETCGLEPGHDGCHERRYPDTAYSKNHVCSWPNHAPPPLPKCGHESFYLGLHCSGIRGHYGSHFDEYGAAWI